MLFPVLKYHYHLLRNLLFSNQKQNDQTIWPLRGFNQKSSENLMRKAIALRINHECFLS